jgi:TatD DNase family protein
MTPPTAGLVDSHCHLDLLAARPEEALAEARAVGVAAVVTVGIDVASSARAVGLAQGDDAVYATVGLHPHDAAMLDDDALDELRRLAASPRVVAVGETGLDFYRDRSPREAQRRVFRSQIELARETGKALVVHTREATAETFELLAERAEGLSVVLHCFSAASRVAECNERGYFVSFAGNLTFKDAADLRDAARLVCEDLLLVETDAPFLAPVPRRGRDNVPAWVVHTAALLGELRGWSAEQTALVTGANARRAFGLGGPGR